MSCLHAIFAGAVVGVLYAAVRVKAPAPPIVALVGLAGMFLVSRILAA